MAKAEAVLVLIRQAKAQAGMVQNKNRSCATELTPKINSKNSLTLKQSCIFVWKQQRCE